MEILVIDGQGGGLGRAVVSALKSHFPSFTVNAAGTNSQATREMIKAGADHAASGENPVVVMARTADIIIGPIGIVIADSILTCSNGSCGNRDCSRLEKTQVAKDYAFQVERNCQKRCLR